MYYTVDLLLGSVVVATTIIIKKQTCFFLIPWWNNIFHVDQSYTNLDVFEEQPTQF